jgi:hypothetical protein
MNRLLIGSLKLLLRLCVDLPTFHAMSSSPSSAGPGSPSAAPDETRRSGRSGLLVGLVLIAALAGLVGVGLWWFSQLASTAPTTTKAVPTTAIQAPGTATSGPATTTPMPASPEPKPASEPKPSGN